MSSDSLLKLIQYALVAIIVIGIAVMFMTEPPVGWVP